MKICQIIQGGAKKPKQIYFVGLLTRIFNVKKISSDLRHFTSSARLLTLQRTGTLLIFGDSCQC